MIPSLNIKAVVILVVTSKGISSIVFHISEGFQVHIGVSLNEGRPKKRKNLKIKKLDVIFTKDPLSYIVS